MFFMMGVYPGQKIFDFTQTEICNSCHKYGRYEVYMTYMQLLLFFIPCFRWKKEYYVRMTCCGTIYRLDPAVGARIARGEDVTIRDCDLTYDRDQNFDPNAFGRGRYGGGYGAGYQDSYDDYGYETDFGRGSRDAGHSSGGGRGQNGSSGSSSGDRVGTAGAGAAQDGPRVRKHCVYCGYETDEDFKYCPKCGRVFF